VWQSLFITQIEPGLRTSAPSNNILLSLNILQQLCTPISTKINSAVSVGRWWLFGCDCSIQRVAGRELIVRNGVDRELIVRNGGLKVKYG